MKKKNNWEWQTNGSGGSAKEKEKGSRRGYRGRRSGSR